MYLILYEDRTGVVQIPRIYSSDVKCACEKLYLLSSFYAEHKYPGISSNMFLDIIDRITIDQAVALHNAICPKYHITNIYKVGEDIYSEKETENETHTSRNM